MWTHGNTPAAKEFVKSLISPDVMAELASDAMFYAPPDPANLEAQLTTLLGYYEQNPPILLPKLPPSSL
jgi:hypothetical protein